MTSRGDKKISEHRPDVGPHQSDAIHVEMRNLHELGEGIHARRSRRRFFETHRAQTSHERHHSLPIELITDVKYPRELVGGEFPKNSQGEARCRDREGFIHGIRGRAFRAAGPAAPPGRGRRRLFRGRRRPGGPRRRGLVRGFGFEMREGGIVASPRKWTTRRRPRRDSSRRLTTISTPPTTRRANSSTPTRRRTAAAAAAAAAVAPFALHRSASLAERPASLYPVASE